MNSSHKFRNNLRRLFAEMASAVNEIADVCKEDELKERFFSFKRCFERGVVLCSGTESDSKGEEAPEFAIEKGESCRIVEL